MFALQAISWGVIPYLIARRKSGWVRILIAVIVSHHGTSFSTLASFLSSYAYSNNLEIVQLLMQQQIYH